jgi:hypothetical protein
MTRRAFLLAIILAGCSPNCPEEKQPPLKPFVDEEHDELMRLFDEQRQQRMERLRKQRKELLKLMRRKP